MPASTVPGAAADANGDGQAGGLARLVTAVRGDVRAALERDPAARSAVEVALCYPGVHAIWGYRVTHWLWGRGYRLAARLLSEVTRVLTGVDIHPGATLGPAMTCAYIAAQDIARSAAGQGAKPGVAAAA